MNSCRDATGHRSFLQQVGAPAAWSHRDRVWAWLQPEISLAALVFFFGAYTLVDGILEVWTSIADARSTSTGG
jgi:Short repeat of unknown function (DUF308)